MEKKQGVLIEKIRKIIIDYVYNTDEKPNKKFSVLLPLSEEELEDLVSYFEAFEEEIEKTKALPQGIEIGKSCRSSIFPIKPGNNFANRKQQ